jgi:nicotinic acid phosphoribosyltransferase
MDQDNSLSPLFTDLYQLAMMHAYGENRLAAKGKPLVDFSFRLTQGLDAGMQVARNAYVSGFTRTSNVLAGKKYGIPVSGTMAHSFVLAIGSDAEAFNAYARSFPGSSIFLIDTHDVIEGARCAADVALKMAKEGHVLKGVCIDSGDIVEASNKVRQILNEAGLHQVKILASSGFDEFEIEKVLSGGAAIDAFGVGTRNENIDETEQLLIKVMENGLRIHATPILQEIRNKIQTGFFNLDDGHKALDHPDKYPIGLSCRLSKIQ